MDQPPVPATINKQLEMLFQAFVDALRDPLIRAYWVWTVSLTAKCLPELNISHRIADAADELRDTLKQRQPGFCPDSFFGTSVYVTATRMAILMDQRDKPVAQCFTLESLRDFIVGLIWWKFEVPLDVSDVSEWPRFLHFEIVRLPDNPLWIDVDGALREFENASPKQIDQFVQVFRYGRGQHPRRGRPRGTIYFGSREEFRELTLQAMRELRKLGGDVTQSKVMEMLGISGDPRRMREFLRMFGVDWQELKNHP